MELLPFAKDLMVSLSGLSKDALHVYLGLALYFGACVILSWRPGMVGPVVVVAVAALVNEAADWWIRYDRYSVILWVPHWHDFLNTVCAPLAITILARTTAIFGKRSYETTGSSGDETEAVASAAGTDDDVGEPGNTF